MGVHRNRILTASALLALAVPAAAPAAVAPGVYKGSTSQNRVVHAKVVKGNKIKRLSFSVYTLCGIGGSGGGFTDVLLVENVRIKPSGKFRATSEGDSANGLATFELIGRATDRKITGSVAQFFRNGCQTFDLTFSAKRR